MPNAIPPLRWGLGAREDELRAEQARDAYNDTLSFGEKFAAGWKDMTATSWMLQQLEKPEMEPDWNFRLSKERFSELTQGIDESFHSELLNARSDKEADFIRDQILESQERMKKIYAGGLFSGLSYATASGILDPLGVITGLAGARLPAMFYKQYRSVNQMRLASAAAGAASNAALEGYIASQSPTVGAEDVLWAAAFGGALGGMFPGLSKADQAATASALASIRDEMDTNALRRADPAIAPKAPALPSPKELEITPDNPDMRFIQPGENVASFFERRAKEAGRWQEKAYGATKNPILKFANKLFRTRRTTIEGMDDPLIREIQTALAGSSTGYKNAVDDIGAITRRDLNVERAAMGIISAFHSAIEVASKKQGKKVSEDLINDALADGLRGIDNPLLREVPELNQQVKALRGILDYMDELETKAGLSNGSVENYFPRITKLSEIDKMPDGENVFIRAVAAGLKGMEPDAALKFAKNYLRALRSVTPDRQIDLMTIFTGDATRILHALDGADLPRSVKDQLMTIAKQYDAKAKNAAQTPGYRKHRVTLDEGAVDPVTGTPLKTFFANDVLGVLHNRVHKGFGRVALSQLGIKGDSDWANLKTMIRTERGLSEKEANEVTEILQSYYDNLMGRPPVGNDALGRGSEALKAAQQLSVSVYMNMMGFSSFAEFGSVVSTVGWKHLLHTMPKVKAMQEALMKGNATTSEVRMMRALVGGFGSSRLMRRMHSHFDADTQEAMGKAREAMTTLNNITMDISGHSMVVTSQQMMYVVGAVSDWMELANKGVRHGHLSEGRLRDFGLSAEDVESILMDIRRHSNGSLEFEDLGFDKWNPKNQEKFTEYLYASGNKYILEPTQADRPMFMDNVIAQAVFQFMGHGMASFDAYIMRNLKHKDMVAARMAYMSMFFGGLSYAALVYLRSLGRDDAKSYREENLSVEKLGTAAFQRSSVASVLPNIADTTLGALGYDPIFSYRSSGLNAGFISGSPTVKLLEEGIPGTVSAFADLMTGESFHRDDWQAFRRLIPFQNAIIIQNYLNHVQQNAPRDYD